MAMIKSRTKMPANNDSSRLKCSLQHWSQEVRWLRNYTTKKQVVPYYHGSAGNCIAAIKLGTKRNWHSFQAQWIACGEVWANWKAMVLTKFWKARVICSIKFKISKWTTILFSFPTIICCKESLTHSHYMFLTWYVAVSHVHQTILGPPQIVHSLYPIKQ